MAQAKAKSEGQGKATAEGTQPAAAATEEKAPAARAEAAAVTEKSVHEAAATVESGVDMAGQAMETGRQSVDSMIKAGADITSEGYGRMMAIGRENVEIAITATSAVVKSYDDLAKAGRDNLTACVDASRIGAQMMEEMGESLTGLMRDSTEIGVSATRAMLGCRNLKDLIDVQSEHMQKLMTQWLDQGTFLSESSFKLASDAAAPFSTRFNEAWQRALRGSAA